MEKVTEKSKLVKANYKMMDLLTTQSRYKEPKWVC